MKTLTYAGDTFLTGDDIADEVLALARALADTGTAATVEIPILTPEGERSRATLLIGPASQIVASPAQSADEELIDDALVAELREKVRATESPRAAMLDDDPVPHSPDIDDTI